MAVQVSALLRRVVKHPRYEVVVDYEYPSGWRGQHQRWSRTKNAAFLDAAYLVGLVRGNSGSDIKISIVDRTTGDEVHKVGDDLYWLY